MIDSFAQFLNAGLGYIIPMIVLLGLLIFVHELGHFLAAKFYKVRVDTFSLGFGPKIIKFLHGGTTYCVSALPLGGYVKMYGDEPGKEVPDDMKAGAYLLKPVGQRIVIVLAGPLMNLIFAAGLFYWIANIGDKALAPEVGEIAPNSVAWEKGFRPYDEILKVNNSEIENWDQIKALIEESGGKSLNFQIKRLGETIDLQLTPKLSENDNLFSTADRIGKVEGLNSDLHMPFIGVEHDSAFYEAGFRTGDRIVEINGEAVTWFKDVEPMILESLYNGDGKAVVKVQRFEDFRKQDGFKELNLRISGADFTNQKLNIFIPETVVAEVQDDSPAQKAGLQRLDRIVSINGEPIIAFEDIIANVSTFEPGDEPLQVKVLRDGQSQVFAMTPKMNELEGRFGEKENRYTIGVIPTLFAAPKTFEWKSKTQWGAMQRAGSETWHWSKVTLLSFVRILQNRVSSKNISGIISIGQVAQKSWTIGLNAFLKMMAIISINLFILNLLPIPILDGGHLLLFTLEAIKGAPISLKKIEVAQQLGFLIILFLMAFALFNDFSRIFGS